MNRIARIATVFSVIAAVGVLPAGAQALDNNNAPGNSGGCNYTDKDGYDIPIDEGQTVFVDGKLVTCKGGTVVITTAPASKPPSKKPCANKLTKVQKLKKCKQVKLAPVAQR